MIDIVKYFLSEPYNGKWYIINRCSSCKNRVSNHEVIMSYGICPHCGVKNTERFFEDILKHDDGKARTTYKKLFGLFEIEVGRTEVWDEKSYWYPKL